ncbi:hypothetical protein [Streptacidiphilus albus]|uniref:hypothetical protein n=1 Tax=Streptacidiphilus albus TaxID=105425 RepID=UPI00054C5924|nr:hypothetical protein [Streptacidiphilus albus]
MARFKNGFGEGRVVPTLGYVLVPDGGEITVPDDEWHHWQAGGWTPLDPDPRPAPDPQPAPEPPAEPGPEVLPAPAAAVLARPQAGALPAAPTAPTTSEDAT